MNDYNDDDGPIDEHEKEALTHSLRFSSRVYSKRHNPCHAVGLIVFSSLYTFLYGGGFYGWGPMQLMLEDNGSYNWKCTESVSDIANMTVIEGDIEVVAGVCPEQTASLINIQFVGVLAVIGAPLIGYIVDKYQAVSLMCFLSFLLMIAFTAFGIAVYYTSPFMDPLLYVAFICFGIVAQSTSILTIETGMCLYPYDEVSRLRVISLLSALFDSGSVTYLGLWALSKSFQLPLIAIVGIYGIMAVICFGGGLYYWIVLTMGPSAHPQYLPLDIDEKKPSETVDTNAVVTSYQKDTTTSSSSSYTKVSDIRPYSKQMLTEPVLLLCCFFSIHFMNNAYTLTTMRDFLSNLGDDEYNNLYLSIFTMILPVSITGVPFVDYIIRKYGFHFGFQTINVLSLLQNSVKLISPNLNIQIIGFVLFTYLRCCLFCITLSYVPILVSPQVNGKCVGIMMFACGIVSFLNLPLANLAMYTYDGNFFVSNSIATVITIPCFFAAYRLGYYMKQEELAK